jgi:beta-lactam-binding protein with PASTA domain/predicted Ser/Thr protein kinase
VSVIESTIEGRYQVITRIASGGMGEVFRAHDAVLRREVAIKVLHPQFAGDRGFVDRFRREAQAAAILNHPNIVGVFDWGSTDGTYFMVMEYVPGLNLRTLLSENGRLEPAQVVEVALQVLGALDHAHRHGIVHRDIKPENILIAQDGTIKVADFGLARAYAESSVSQADGTVTGTVQYLSPEQIQGEPADPRTDLYSFGVVAFELLTGRPPFAGETSLSIAYQHLSGRVPAPSAVAPRVPAVLDEAVLRATEKDRDGRPPSARALRDDFALIGVGLPSARPVAQVAAQIPPSELVPQDRATTVTIPRARSARARRSRRIRLLGGLLVLLALLGLGAWVAWVYAVPHYTEVPNVLGVTPQQATARLQATGLKISIGPAVFSSTVESGVIVRTRPPPGTRIETGSPVVVITSKGPELVGVPDVGGKPERAALTVIHDAGFETKVKRAFDEGVREGRVISQNPDPGQEIERGSLVTITVSKGPAPVEVPNVVGQPESEARATLRALGFTVEEVEEFSLTVARGRVIATDPPAGASVPRGTEVTIVVSLGPKTVEMPNVVGMSGTDAETKLRGLGLEVEVVPVPSTTPPDTVVFQEPAAGTTVEQGQTVRIFVTGH